MNLTSKRVKADARQLLIESSFGAFTLTVLLYTIIDAVAGNILSYVMSANKGAFAIVFNSLLQFLISVVIALLYVGFYKIALAITRKEAWTMGDLFYGFKHSPDSFLIVIIILNVIKFLFTQIPQTIFSQLAVTHVNMPDLENLKEMYEASKSLLGISLSLDAIKIAGTMIYLAVTAALSLCFFLMIDNPSMKGMESVRESIRLMKGHKWFFFFTSGLSFIGFLMLSSISMEMVMIWMIPYNMVVKALLYRAIRAFESRRLLSPNEEPHPIGM